MSSKSNDQGRAFEYISLLTLQKEISKKRPAKIDEDSSFYAAQLSYNAISDGLKLNLEQSAKAMIPTIFELEPLIVEDGSDDLELSIQKDKAGESGDVRDILIVRRNIKWEIGLSIKHNHFAVKHSRLSPQINFGEKWYGHPCSPKYETSINKVFSYFTPFVGKYKWSQLPDKEANVYIPLLKAFKEEILDCYKLNKDIPKRMIEYLLGKFDFYKIISIDNKKMTEVQTYNLHGTLNNHQNKNPHRQQFQLLTYLQEL